MSSRASGKFVLLVLLIVVGAAVVARGRTRRPCARPVTWSIGTIDSRFRVHRDELLVSARDAAGIWNAAAGHDVLAFVPGGENADVRINLVYDARQANASRRDSLVAAQSAQDTARRALDALDAELSSRQADYDQRANALTARGVPDDSVARALEPEHASIQLLADSLHRAADAYNAKVAAIRAMVDQFNEGAGRLFDVGHYVRDSTGERIDVFEFADETELERVLAHEFGHALGLGHNGDSLSIMYERNEGGSLTPSPEDLASLRGLCGR